ncbi:MAG: endonuclease [Bacteroidales bacterium]|nr:endonuclease [Bacteroidales bacterium]
MKKRLLVLTLGIFLVYSGIAQIPAGYYDQATGKSGEVLRAALRDITTTGHIKIPYTSTSFDIWNAYAVTDVRPAPNNTIIWDMYSDIPNGSPAYTFTIYTNQCGTASAEGDCYSREHCMPNSWWGGLDNTANPQYSDLHHLFPADQYVNNKKSNYVVAQTSTPTWTSTNGSKLGPCTYPGYTGTVFEPINDYKGDFARAYLYLATRYMNYLSTWVTTYPSYESKYIINETGGNYKQWYIDLLISWNNSDPVSQKEIDRNNNIYYYTPQHNRNPFIDHPEYVCLVWSCVSSPVITNIVSTPAAPNSTSNVSVSATITDDVSLSSVTLQWCTDGFSFANSIAMYENGATNYVTTSLIPTQVAGATVTYRILASDSNGSTTTSFTSSYTIIKDEPTSYPVSFSCGTSTSSTIALSWIDATTPVTPDGYLVKASSVSLAAITDPADGVSEANGPLVKNVAQGAQTINLTGLAPSTTYYFKIYPYTNSASNIDYKTLPAAPNTSCVTLEGEANSSCAADLLISEYIEGSGNNKYIEISNNTGVSVDLSDYKLQLYANGATTPTNNIALAGTLADQTTIVYKNASATLYSVATSNAAVNFNGNDAIVLFKTSTNTFVDIFGRIGENPGTAWTSDSYSTFDKVLVRNSSVTSGITVNPASGFPTLTTEWTQYSIDDISHLGSHIMTCLTCISPDVQSGDIIFSAVSQTAMTINWINGDGEKRILVMRQGTPVTETPITGNTYTPDTVFGLGNELGADEYVVYNNSGSSVTVSNLVADQTYYVSIFEYNCLPGSEIYLTPAVSSSQIAFDPLPANAGTITGPTIVCQGQNALIYTVPPIDYATSYIWTLPGGAIGSSITNKIDVNFTVSAVSGDISVKGTNAFGNGIASTIAVIVNTIPASPTITANGIILHSDAAQGNQWYKQAGIITEATNQDYTVTADGNYYVIVTDEGCSSDTSNTIDVVAVGIEISHPYPTINVFPDPFSDELNIEFKGNVKYTNFQISNSSGVVVFKGKVLEKAIVRTLGFSPGVYFLKLENGKDFKYKKLIKVK